MGALHRGRTLAVLETEITRADGALVAKVTRTQASTTRAAEALGA